MNDLVRRALVSVQIPAIREPPGLSRKDGKRPDGLTLLPWTQGKSLVWDFTCSDTLAPSHIEQNSTEAGKSALPAEKKKLSHYENLSASGFIVMPIAAETMGSWAPMAMKFIKEIGSRLTGLIGERRSTSFLFQSIGIAIQRGNAASVLGTIPNTKKLDEIYNL